MSDWATTIRGLHEKFRAKFEMEGEPIPAFSGAQLAQLEEACGHTLPAELRAALGNAGVFGPAPEVYLEDVGYFCLTSAETLIEDAQKLKAAIEEYDWDVPACCTLSFVNNGFIAYDLEEKRVLFIDGDDGEVTDLGFGLDALFDKYATLWVRSSKTERDPWRSRRGTPGRGRAVRIGSSDDGRPEAQVEALSVPCQRP